MIRKLLLINLVVLLIVLRVQAQSYQWITGGGSVEMMSSSAVYEQINNVCSDDHGNVYVTAITGALDISADTFHMAFAHNTGVSSPHILFASYDCAGHMRWAKLIESYNAAQAGGIAYSNGSVYLVGRMVGGTKYIGYDTMITSENMNSFTLKMDTAGSFQWIRFVGQDILSTASLANAVGAIGIDKDGNIHNFNFIKSGCQFSSTMTIATAGTYDIKYNPAGDLLSAVRVPGLDSVWLVKNIQYSKTTNKCYTSLAPGGYWFSIYSDYEYGVAAFDAADNLLWMDTTGMATYAYVSKVQYDGHNGLYVGGAGGAGIPYALGGITTTTAYGGDFGTIYKLDTNGVAHWAYDIPCPHDVEAVNDITLLPNQNVAMTGYYVGVIKNGSDSLVTPSGELNNPFLLVVDSGGHTLKLDQMHGPGFDDWGVALAADNSGNIYLGGCFDNPITATGLSSLESHGGNTDFYLVKYGYVCGCTTMPTANFTSAGSSTVAFSYTGSTGYDSVRWYFGDGGTSTTASPTHAYAASGTYHACVTVYAGCGSDTHCADITVVVCSTTPVASFTSSGTGSVSFTYTGTTSYDSVRWYFGDGNTSSAVSPTHSYITAGTYTVCVMVYSTCGNDTACSTVTVCAMPAPAYTSTVAGHIATFTYTGSTGYDSLRWHFGDGTTSTTASPAHTYTLNGTYHACVYVYNSCGVDSFCTNVVIHPVSVTGAAFEELKVYPNPGREMLVIEHAGIGSTLRLMDMTGKEVYRGVVQSERWMVDVRMLPVGPYLLQVTDTEGNRRVMTIVKD